MKYEPELGQMMFGQPPQEFQASDLMIAALEAIREDLSRVYWNKNQAEIQDPFGNTGGRYKNDTFEVEAYSWDEEKAQPYNFKFGDIEVSWYKYLGRGTSVNRGVSNNEIETMLTDCLESLRKEDVLHNLTN